jgi:hypothetical protein
MSSIAEVLTLDYQIDDLRLRIAIEKERIAQRAVEGAKSINERAVLDDLERNLEGLLSNREKAMRELEGSRSSQREAS